MVPGLATVSYATTSRAPAGAAAMTIPAAARATRPLCVSIPEVLSRTFDAQQCAGIRVVPVGEDSFQIVIGRAPARKVNRASTAASRTGRVLLPATLRPRAGPGTNDEHKACTR